MTRQYVLFAVFTLFVSNQAFAMRNDQVAEQVEKSHFLVLSDGRGNVVGSMNGGAFISIKEIIEARNKSNSTAIRKQFVQGYISVLKSAANPRLKPKL